MQLTVRSSILSSRRGHYTHAILGDARTYKHYLLVDANGVKKCTTMYGHMGHGSMARMQWDRRMGDRVYTVWSRSGMDQVIETFNKYGIAGFPKVKEGYH